MLQEFFPVLGGVPMGDLWILLTWGLLIMGFWMLAFWVWHLKFPDAHLMGFGWISGLTFLGVFYALEADGYGMRRLLIGTMVFLWGVYLSRRAWLERPDVSVEESGDDLEGENGKRFPALRTLIVSELKAVLAVILSIPMALLVIDPLQSITGYEWLGLLLWAAGMAGLLFTDSRRRLFEWLIWLAYFVASLGTAYGAWTVVCPLIMLVLLKRAGPEVPVIEETQDS